MAASASSPPLASFTDAFRIDVKMVEAGVSVDTMTRFLSDVGLELKDVYDLVIPARTLKHRRTRAQHLSQDESDKLARLIRVFDHAVRVFGEVDKARRWLGKPKERFEEKTPLQMLRTEVGARLVDEMLGQIDHGIFA